jgi:hypothetical protein
MVEEFAGATQDQQFKDWLQRHPHGFYLNEGSVGNIQRGAGGMILHRVGCHHLGGGEGVISTTYGKAASDDLEELMSWAERKGLGVVGCSSCKPD